MDERCGAERRSASAMRCFEAPATYELADRWWYSAVASSRSCCTLAEGSRGRSCLGEHGLVDRHPSRCSQTIDLCLGALDEPTALGVRRGRDEYSARLTSKSGSPSGGSGNLGRTPKVPSAPWDVVPAIGGNEVSGPRPSTRRRTVRSRNLTGDQAVRAERHRGDTLAGRPHAAAERTPTSSAASRHGRVAARRPARPAAVLRPAPDRPFALEGGGQLAGRHRSPTRRGASSTPTRATPSSSATPSPATPTPPDARARATRPPGWWDGWSAPAGRSTPTATSWSAPTCSAAARAPPARRRPQPDDGRPLRQPASRSSPSATWSATQAAPGRRTSASTAGSRVDRRVDGRHAGARVGRDVPRPGARSLVPIATCAAATAQQIALVEHGPAGHRARPAAGAAATTTTPRPATVPTTGWPWPA